MLGFSQLLGGWTKWGFPVLSPGVFLLGFLPALILGGGILLATRDTGQGTRETVSGWAQDLGIEGFVQDVSVFQGAIAVAIGLVFSFVFDTAGPRREYVAERTTTVPDEDVHDYDRPEPVTTTVPAEDRTVVDRRWTRDDVVTSTPRTTIASRFATRRAASRSKTLTRPKRGASGRPFFCAAKSPFALTRARGSPACLRRSMT